MASAKWRNTVTGKEITWSLMESACIRGGSTRGMIGMSRSALSGMTARIDMNKVYYVPSDYGIQSYRLQTGMLRWQGTRWTARKGRDEPDNDRKKDTYRFIPFDL
jgi:hypothetical protein